MALLELGQKGDLVMAHRTVGLLGMLLVCLSSGCATSTTGEYQSITVTSEPMGAKIRTTNGLSLVSPGSLCFRCDKDDILVAEYPGCKSQQKELKHKSHERSRESTLWGRIIGGDTDLAPGPSGTLKPNEVHFEFGQFDRLDAP